MNHINKHQLTKLHIIERSKRFSLQINDDKVIHSTMWCGSLFQAGTTMFEKKKIVVGL